MDMNTAVSLLNIKEDLMDDEVESIAVKRSTREFARASANGKARVAKSKRRKAEIKPYERLLASASKKLGCTTSELSNWLNHAPNTPESVQQNALRLITKHSLDPFSDEIAIYQYEDRHWQAFITIDGWSKLINEHPAFNGIGFTESTELVGGIPAWMGCSIHRNDRVVPIEVKEYLCEIQTEHSIWKDMPRRMLRHRVIAQCARLAFGVSIPEFNNRVIKVKNTENELVSIKTTDRSSCRVDILKAYLNKDLN